MTSNKETNKDSLNEMRNKLIIKVIPIIRKNGFQSLRMDDMAKYMDISKATMYKYFASKEEIIQGVVDILTDYINELVMQSQDTEQSYGSGFQRFFEQSVLLTAYISDIFLDELKGHHPHLYQLIEDTLRQREAQISKFYQKGKSEGIFHDINEHILFVQEDAICRALLDLKFLLRNHLTLNQALFDYYVLKKIQLFKPDYIHSSDDSIMKPKIEHMANKITRDLF